eukprot:1150493-Pelagomonas_calceolata.AAC.5
MALMQVKASEKAALNVHKKLSVQAAPVRQYLGLSALFAQDVESCEICTQYARIPQLRVENCLLSACCCCCSSFLGGESRKLPYPAVDVLLTLGCRFWLGPLFSFE